MTRRHKPVGQRRGLVTAQQPQTGHFQPRQRVCGSIKLSGAISKRNALLRVSRASYAAQGGALGNAVCVPVAGWLLRRVAAVLAAPAEAVA